MDVPLLPTLNALLNALAAALLLRGRALVRQGRIDAHRRTMLAAFATSTLFLVLYVTHKASRGFESTSFHARRGRAGSPTSRCSSRTWSSRWRCPRSRSR